MKIVIFGASGVTGMLLTERCLSAGYEVTVLVRTPGDFRFSDQVRVDRLRVVEGSIFDPVAVRQTVEGADVVLSTLGARSLKKEDVLERAIPLIVAAMRQAGVRRIVTLGGASGVSDSLQRQPWLVRTLLRRLLYDGLFKWPSAEQRSQLASLGASGLDWTTLLPPMLTNGPARGQIRVDAEALPERGRKISRADVADFMMQQIWDTQWVGKGVYVSW